MRGRDPALNETLVEMAKDTVMGVVTAREGDDCSGAEFVLSSYIADAIGLGATPGQAWAMLFSAASLWVSTLIELIADLHHETPAEAISRFALAHAQGDSQQ